jgi:hypothetical protein
VLSFWSARRTLGLVAIVTFASATLSGCSAALNGVGLGKPEHIHSAATDGEEFFLASEQGLYVWTGSSWDLRGEVFDVMGLAINDGVFYASGHPGLTQDLPNPLGLLLSDNAGETWRSHSLSGHVDFHLLRVSGDTLVGIAANFNSVLVSTDGGTNWLTLVTPVFTDLDMNPTEPREMLLVSDGALFLSTDAATSFSQTPAPDDVLLVDWSDNGVFLASSSALFRSDTYNGTFVRVAQKFTNIAAIGASSDAVIVLDDQGVHMSTDGGATFDSAAS